MMIHEWVLTVGQVIGVSIAGGIYDKLGWTNVLFVIASIGVVFVICQFGVNLLRKKKGLLHEPLKTNSAKWKRGECEHISEHSPLILSKISIN